MNWLKKRIEKLELSTSSPIGKNSFMYLMAKKQDPDFEGDGRGAVSLFMQGLRADYKKERQQDDVNG